VNPPAPVVVVFWDVAGFVDVLRTEVEVTAGGPVEVSSTGNSNGSSAQPTAVIPGKSTRSPYPQYGDAESVLH